MEQGEFWASSGNAHPALAATKHGAGVFLLFAATTSGVGCKAYHMACALSFPSHARALVAGSEHQNETVIILGVRFSRLVSGI